MARYLLIAWIAFIVLSSPVRADDRGEVSAEISAYLNVAEHDARLANIGYRLSVANAGFCPNTLPNMGWVLHDIAQYDDSRAVETVFNFERQISILKLVDGGLAEKAGVQEGDGFIGISYERSFHDAMGTMRVNITSEPYTIIALKNHYDRIQMVQKNINNVLEIIAKYDDAVPIVTLIRDGEILKLPFALNKACASDYILDARSKIDAGANGHHVRVTLGLSEFLYDDDEYAAALAHELAHNILEHRKMLADGKVGRGPLAGLGRNKRIRVTEEQADRLAIWLMANAGFDAEAGPRMIARLRKRKGLSLFSYRTHNKWKKRLEFMNQEIAGLTNIMPDAQGRRVPPLINALITK